MDQVPDQDVKADSLEADDVEIRELTEEELDLIGGGLRLF